MHHVNAMSLRGYSLSVQFAHWQFLSSLVVFQLAKFPFPRRLALSRCSALLSVLELLGEVLGFLVFTIPPTWRNVKKMGCFFSFGLDSHFGPLQYLLQFCLLFLVGAFLVKSARLLQWLVFLLFLFSRRFSRELLQWLVFFRQTTDLIAYVPLFTDFTLAHMYSSVLGLRWTQRSRVRVLALARNFFDQFLSALCDSFNFFRHCATFFWKFFCRQRVPLQVFWYFATTCLKLKFQKAQMVPPFWFFGTMRLFQKSHFSFFLENFPKNFLNFLNVSKGSPFNFFDILQQTGFSKSRKGSPLTNIKNCAFLSLRYSADFRRSRLVFFSSDHRPHRVCTTFYRNWLNYSGQVRPMQT